MTPSAAKTQQERVNEIWTEMCHTPFDPTTMEARGLKMVGPNQAQVYVEYRAQKVDRPTGATQDNEV